MTSNTFKDNLLIEGGALNAFVAIKFLQLITKPFNKWPAFNMGLINGDGEKIRDAESDAEKKEMSLFHIIIKNMKRLLIKIPGGRSKIASYAAGLWLIKESRDFDSNDTILLTQYLIEWLENNDKTIEYPIIQENITQILPKGKYIMDDNTMLVVKEQLIPVGNLLGVSIYKTIDRLSGNDKHFTNENILRVI